MTPAPLTPTAQRLTPAEREHALLAHWGVVHGLARQFAAMTPDSVEFDDLFQVGMEALLVCIDRYDPHVGATLQGFAHQKVAFALLDYLRATDGSRMLRQRWRMLQEAQEWRAQLTGTLQPCIDIALLLGWSPAQFIRTERRIEEVNVESLEDEMNPISNMGDHLSNPWEPTTDCWDHTVEDPADMSEQHERCAQVRRAMRVLSEREQAVLQQHCFAGHTLREIGEQLGVGESRACQIYKGALRQLRALLQTGASPREMTHTGHTHE